MPVGVPSGPVTVTATAMSSPYVASVASPATVAPETSSATVAVVRVGKATDSMRIGPLAPAGRVNFTTADPPLTGCDAKVLDSPSP